MARYSTCKLCGNKIKPTDEKFKISNKTYCKNCYQIKQKEQEDYKNLINITLDYFNLEQPNGRILKQIKEYKENYKYTYAGIGYCLWYLKEIKNINFQIKYGIALVTYEYENAKSYFLNQQKIENSLKTKHEKAKINIVKVSKFTNDLSDKLLFNLDDL